MLKNRIVATLLVNDGIVVQSVNFKKYLPVGRVDIAVEFLNDWGIDEIVLLDIKATLQNRSPNLTMISQASKKGFVPLTVGGGIKTVSDIKNVIQSGADKVSINYAAITQPSLIEEGAIIFGNQCIMVSIDTRKNQDGQYEVFTQSGRLSMGKSPVEVAKISEDYGAGEILLNSIDRDGSKQGYDIELIQQVTDAVKIPVIACGGVGHPRHFLEGITLGKASAVAAGNYFHFTEHSVITTKSYLENDGIGVRLNTYAHYKDFNFLETGRLARKIDEDLEELRFTYHPKEII